MNWRDPGNPEAGGAEVHLHEVARRLVTEGHACIQVSHAFPGGAPDEMMDGVRMIRVGGKFLFNFTVLANIRRWCNEFEIDAVLDDSNKIAFLLPWFCPRPVVLQLHHLFGSAIFRETSWPLALYVLAFEKLMPLCYRNTRVLTGSESSRRELLSKGFRKVDIAPEGVNPEHYVLASPPARIPGLIAYVGRVKRYKGLETLLQALVLLRKTHPESTLVVAGSGDDVPRLKALSDSLGISGAVEFTGFVTEARKLEIYHQARVVVNSSLKEGWGLTSIEANACGTPVVATDVPGLCDSVRHDETGFLVPFGGAQAFATALANLLEDSALWNRLSINARQWAAAHTWEPAFQKTRDALVAAREEFHARA